MKRKELKLLCRQITDELEKRPYAEWQAVSFPHVYSERRGNAEINVELVLLENKPDYLHVAVCVDDEKWTRKLMPVSGSFLVKKPAAK